MGGEWLSAPEYWTARLLLHRALGAIYLVAFLVAVNQVRPLLGDRGLTPARRVLAATRFWQTPSLFQFHYSDRFAVAVAGAGAALSAAVVVGLPERGPAWATMLTWFVLWALYLSFVNVGRPFYGFGWESLLLEAGFLAIFLGPAWMAPPLPVLFLLRWLLFRVEFGAGLIKLRGDPCWRDLTCLEYHHETQPMPGPASWYFHHLPRPLHRVEVAANHVAQLVAPVALFLPQPVAAVAGASIVVTQAWLVASGNFAWLNVLTIVLAVAAFDDAVLGGILPAAPAELAPVAGWFQVVVVAVTVLVVARSYHPVRNLLSHRQLMNASFDPFHLVNTYGAFGSITRRRLEIVVEGTDSLDDDRPGGWRDEFKGKPGDPGRRPPQVAPYHLRLDWMMWFAAMSAPNAHPWFLQLLVRLLEGDPATLGLLRRNPFPDTPPAAVRARLYHYRFRTPAERRRSGAWWVRTLVGDYVPPLALDRDGVRLVGR